MHELASKALFLEQTEHITLKLAKERGWVLHQMEYPAIDLGFTRDGRTTLRLRLACSNWNSDPPSILLLTTAGEPLRPVPPLPVPPLEIAPNPSGIFNPSPHPNTGMPFICMPGSREYHTHSSHINDFWDAYRIRSGYDLGGLITQIWHGWLKGSG